MIPFIYAWETENTNTLAPNDICAILIES